MRTLVILRSLTPFVTAGLLCGCGGTTPTAPGTGSTTLQIPTGPQVLRIVNQGSLCSAIDRASLPMVYTPVTVTRAGSEWIATATGAAGDVELRIHTLGGGGIALRVAGTIKGTAIHIPEVAAGPTVWHGQASFGSDGRTTLDGVIFPLMQPSTTIGAFDGIGTGATTFSDTAGGSCSGTSFSWMLFPQM